MKEKQPSPPAPAAQYKQTIAPKDDGWLLAEECKREGKN